MRRSGRLRTAAIAVAATVAGAGVMLAGPVIAVSRQAHCRTVAGLPDRTCTPGALSPAVTQANIATTICVSGYTNQIRPPTSYTNPLKLEQMQEYGLNGPLGDYEEDHLVSLQLGGDPNSPQNLWPEPYAPTPGARQKDTVETALKRDVCAGKRSLDEAQQLIRTDWLKVWRQIQAAKPTPSP